MAAWDWGAIFKKFYYSIYSSRKCSSQPNQPNRLQPRNKHKVPQLDHQWLVRIKKLALKARTQLCQLRKQHIQPTRAQLCQRCQLRQQHTWPTARANPMIPNVMEFSWITMLFFYSSLGYFFYSGKMSCNLIPYNFPLHLFHAVIVLFCTGFSVSSQIDQHRNFKLEK